MEHNFILTDVMKTGYNPLLHKFISYQTITNQTFEYDEEYYRIPFYDLKKYNRQIACLFPVNVLHKSLDYCEDLQKRLDKIKLKEFKLVISEPWESQKTIEEKFNKLEIKNIVKNINYTFWAGGASWFWFYMYDKHKNKNFKFDHSYKKFDFLYLNKTNRPHREQLFNKLFDCGILTNSLYTFTSKGIKLDKEYELPWAPIPYPERGMDQDIYELPYNHSAYNIVSETHTHDEIFMTEKIWKPIIAQQIFVVHGKQHYLKDLQELGFQTFGNIFDESYDAEADDNKRIEKIVDLCKWLKKQNYQQLYKKTESIRKHNLEHFFNRKALEPVINKTLLGLLEFFDSSQVSS